MSTSAPPPGGTIPDRPELPEGIVRAPVLISGPAGMRAVPLWAPLAVLFGGILASLIAAALTAVPLVAAGVDIDSDDAEQALTIFGTFGQAAGWILLSFVVVRRATRADAAGRLGIRRADLWAAVGWGALVYVGFWIGAGVVGVVFGTPDAEQQLVTDLKNEDNLAILLGLGVLATVVAPLGEEVLFRGLLFGTLRSRMRAAPAALIAGPIFGAVHFDAPAQGILLLCVLGVALCVLYELTGSLVPCLALHALHNSIVFSVTKELPWWGFSGVMIGSVVVVVVAGLLMGRVRTVAPVPA